MNVTGTIQSTDITGRLQSTDITGTISEIDNLDDFYEIFWSNYPGVLFFGLLSELEDGRIPNKVTGSSDYLTVSGLPGEEVFQCPNEPQYIAADTDYIWFKTDASQRTVTTAELIGYDLQRTPVRYLDDAPNSISAILILNTTLTGVKRDALFRDLWLSVLWDNSFNVYGHIKSNRFAQQLWTPESVYEPEVITYVNGLTTPQTETQLNKLNTLVTTLKTGLNVANLSDYFDVFALSSGETSECSLRNLVKNAHHGVLGGATPAFVAFEGFESATSTGYVDTNFNPATQGVRFTETANGMGVYVRDDVAAGSTKTIMGNGTFSRWMLRYTGDLVRGANNGGAVGNPLIENSLTKGFYIFKRTGNTIGASKNGAAFTDIANNSAPLTSFNYFVLGDNNEGVFRYGSDNQLSCYFFGKDPTDAEAVVINSAIEAYMDSNNKGVQ